jgi:hypothetical protein
MHDRLEKYNSPKQSAKSSVERPVVIEQKKAEN